MARKNTSNLDNQISLLDMMVSESPDYIEEKSKENQEISANVKDDIEQADEHSHPKTSKPAKTRTSISTQTLKVVKAVYTDTVETNWEDLFDGFDRLYAITFSSGIEFVNKVINKFSYAEVVFGCEKIIANDIAAIMSVQIDSVQRLAKSKSAGNLANRLNDGSLQLYVSRDTKSHEKIFILESADHKHVRVITGSANMSASAFYGIQRENIVCFDDEAAFAHYKILFDTFKETCSDNVSYKTVVNTMDKEDYLKENIEEVPVFQSIEKQKYIFLEQAQPEDEIEYEIVADVKKMQELVKPIMPKMPVKANRIVVAPEPMRVFAKRYSETRRVAAETVKEFPKLHIDYDAGTMTFSTAAAPVGLGLPRNEVLWMLMMAVIGFGVMVPVAGLLADAFGRRKSMVIITTLIILFALFAFTPLLGSGNPILVFAFLLLGLSLMGLTFGPMGALLPELFPTEVRYTGASFSYNVASILGASVAPYIAAWLQTNYGLGAVGLYLAAMAGLTLIALLLTHETRHQSL